MAEKTEQFAAQVIMETKFIGNQKDKLNLIPRKGPDTSPKTSMWINQLAQLLPPHSPHISHSRPRRMQVIIMTGSPSAPEALVNKSRM
jgi:hypothetical protein